VSGFAALAFGAEENGDPDSDQDGGRDKDFCDGEELVGLVLSGDHGEDDGQAGAEESNDGQCDGDGATSGDAYDVRAGGTVLDSALEADHRCEEEKIGNEVGDDRHADEDVIGSADRGAGLA